MSKKTVFFDPHPNAKHSNCLNCGRFESATFPFIPASGDSNPDLITVGQDPGKTEDKTGLNFVGDAGNYLEGVEFDLGIRKQFRVARLNTVRCFSDHPPTPAEMKCCRSFLIHDIKKANPKLVVALGAYALRTLCGVSNISQRQGVPLESKFGFTVLPVYHPAHILRDPRHQKSFYESMARALSLLQEKSGKATLAEKLNNRYIYVDTIELAAAALVFLKKQSKLQFDTEYEPLDYLDPAFKVLGVSVSWGPKTGVFFPLDHPQTPFNPTEIALIKENLKEILETIPISGHSLEGDIAVAHKCLGVDIMKIKIAHDTLYGSMAVFGKQTVHKLGVRAYTEADTGGYDAEVEQFKKEHKIKGYGEIPIKMLGVPYAAGDTDTCAQLEEYQRSRISKMKQDVYMYNVAVPSIRLNYIMRTNGLLIDWDEWNKRWKYWLHEKATIYEKARQIPEVNDFAEHLVESTNKKFSLKSRQQVLQILTFLKIPYKTNRITQAGGPSLDEAALLIIKEAAKDHPHIKFVDTLLKVNEIDKALGTYCEGIASQVYPDGRVHAKFHHFTESGRRGSTEPNIQNIPIKNTSIPTYEGMAGPDDMWNFRMLFRSKPGWKFVVPDYAQLEMRTAACYSNDPALIEACRSDDPHQLTANRINIPRKVAKTVNFLIIYGGSAPKLQAEIWKKAGEHLPLEKCEDIIAETQKIYSRLWAHIENTHENIKNTGFVTTPLGQVRLLPHAQSSTNNNVIERAKREGWNHQNQALGHSLLSIAMDAVQDIIYQNNLSWLIENDTHDGFVMEVPDAEVSTAVKITQRVMENHAPKILGDWLKVPLPAEAAVGTHLGNLKEMEI